MRFEGLLEPVSASAPSGPDLEETGDWEYSNYMLLAGGQLPSRFFTKDTDGSDRELPFDKSKINLEAELEAINGFLARSRDIRLLTLEARFQALSGSITGFGDCLQDLAGIVETFWDSFHPVAADGDYIFRQNTLEGLEDQVQIILPLIYAPIVGSGGRSVSYRNYLVASGKAKARPDEATMTLDDLQDMLSDDRNGEQALAVNEAIHKSLTALDTIRNVFVERAGHVNAPSFERLRKTLSDIGAAVAASRPLPTETPPATMNGAAALGLETLDAAPSVGTVQILSHAQAAAALAAAEQYFQSREPSAPALILVHQARMLFGKPLVAALEALFPETAGNAVLRFESGLRFDIGLPQMKLVIDDVAATSAAADSADTDSPDSDMQYPAASRSDATALLVGVETFYRTAEPSSPVPYLLAKARSYLGKDFSSILNEILPRESS